MCLFIIGYKLSFRSTKERVKTYVQKAFLNIKIKAYNLYKNYRRTILLDYISLSILCTCMIILVLYSGSVIYERKNSSLVNVVKLEETADKNLVTLGISSNKTEITSTSIEVKQETFNRLHTGDKYYGLVYVHSDGSIMWGTTHRSIFFIVLGSYVYLLTHNSLLVTCFAFLSLIMVIKYRRHFLSYKLLVHLILALLTYEYMNNPWIIEYGISSIDDILTGWVIYASILEIFSSLVGVLTKKQV